MNIAQLATLATSIKANPEFWNGTTQLLNNEEIADFYNAKASPEFYVWNPAVEVDHLFDLILWANLTPASPTTDTTNIYLNRLGLCQSKQANIQIILSGRQTIDATKANIRAGLQDALSAIPSKADGTLQNANWNGVRVELYKTATNVEKLFSTGTGDTANPALYTFEGSVTPDNVATAVNG